MSNIAAASAANGIRWFDHTQFKVACERARQEAKPILLDMHSPRCPGTLALERDVYSRPEVQRAIMETAIPIRVVTDSDVPNAEKSAIIGRHIFLWSPTVQMLNPDGVYYHEFHAAPRHTRLAAGYTRVHHELSPAMPPDQFLGQLALGAAKYGLENRDFVGAASAIRKVLERFPADGLVREEAKYWLGIAEAGAYPSMPNSTEHGELSPLGRDVAALCDALVRLPDARIMDDWKGELGPGGWEFYTDNIREVVYGLYQTLISLANDVLAARGGEVTLAHRILMRHHRAFRDVLGQVVGFGDDILDQSPIWGERTIRSHYAHLMMAEWWAHTPQIRHARTLLRTGKAPETLSSNEVLEQYGRPPVLFGPLTGLFERYEVVHRRVITEFADLTDAELAAPTIWWEPKPFALRFRLDRLGWHLYDHSTIIENQLNRMGKVRTETQRFARQILSALGEAEAALIGTDPKRFEADYANVAAFVRKRTGEITALLSRAAN